MIIALFQRKLIYHPYTAPEASLLLDAQSMGILPWRNENKEIIGWKTKPPEIPNSSPYRMLIFHGNAGYALHRVTYAWCLLDSKKIPWEVFLLEYPGYGARKGSPSETNNIQAAEEALNQLWENNPQPIYLLGESLGGGVACALASRHPEKIAGILLTTPFNNLTDVGVHHFWFLPVRLILQESYDSEEALKKYKGPLAILLAEEDEVIPKELGLKLYHSYSGPKEHWIVPGATHNTMSYSPQQSWWKEAIQFLMAADDKKEKAHHKK